jgi:hypothetical protein
MSVVTWARKSGPKIKYPGTRYASWMEHAQHPLECPRITVHESPIDDVPEDGGKKLLAFAESCWNRTNMHTLTPSVGTLSGIWQMSMLRRRPRCWIPSAPNSKRQDRQQRIHRFGISFPQWQGSSSTPSHAETGWAGMASSGRAQQSGRGHLATINITAVHGSRRTTGSKSGIAPSTGGAWFCQKYLSADQYSTKPKGKETQPAN